MTKILDRCRHTVTAAGEKCRASPCGRAGKIQRVRQDISYTLVEGDSYPVAGRPRVAAMRTNAATDAARVVRITRPRWSPQHRNESGACAENLGKLMLQVAPGFEMAVFRQRPRP
jgi:hypothetical protein